MNRKFQAAGAVLLLAGSWSFAMADSKPAQDLTGRWDAQLLSHGPPIDFRLDLSGSDSSLKGTFFDGPRPYETTTSATYENGQLVLKAEHYLTTITATLQDGVLTGKTVLAGPGYSIDYAFRAVRHKEQPTPDAKNVPAIAGSWEIPLESPSPKGEKAFRFFVEQQGAEVFASILRVDGDTGSFSGTFKEGKWVLSHFDGHRPGLIEVSKRADGALDVVTHNEGLARALNSEAKEGYSEGGYAPTATLVAYRPEVARAKGFPEPANFLAHTTARDPNEKFAFSFPDVNGKLVSNEDPQFKGKVVIAVVTGTWCPNCHDEAQYLVELDKKYRDKGLAIVALNFEEPEQQATLARVHAFVKQYGVTYPYLIAGAPAEMWEKVPQLVNLNTWPATVFVGRDGTVRAVHSGFASPASGQYHAELRKDFTQRIEKLLAEKAGDATKVSALPAGTAQAMASSTP